MGVKLFIAARLLVVLAVNAAVIVNYLEVFPGFCFYPRYMITGFAPLGRVLFADLLFVSMYEKRRLCPFIWWCVYALEPLPALACTLGMRYVGLEDDEQFRKWDTSALAALVVLAVYHIRLWAMS